MGVGIAFPMSKYNLERFKISRLSDSLILPRKPRDSDLVAFFKGVEAGWKSHLLNSHIVWESDFECGHISL